jgi:xylan 1,4-beta-xylosidase
VGWEPVDGAAGYLVHRAPAPDGPWAAIDARGGDVLAVPHSPYVDTTGDTDAPAWYSVASLAEIEARGDNRSVGVEPVPIGNLGRVAIDVDGNRVVGPVHRPWRPIIGSEHLQLLLRGPGAGGRHVGEELAEAFRIVRSELGVERVRAHAILHDSLGVYREVDGQPVHNFSKVDLALERLLRTGLRPIVELSFMPRDLAADPGVSVFDYVGIISPPRDWDRWGALIRDLVAHCVERFGHDEVATWAWEVWNEANLRVFWSGTESEYLRLYDVSAAAVKSVDPSFAVGGPATAAAGWVDDLLLHARESGVPLDFLSTHTYGMAPLDLRPIAARYGRPDIPLWWTEWGVSPTHGSAINDSVWGAPLVARGMRSSAGRLESLAYWVASDHFVELGEPHQLFHGGFGLLTLGNLRKPRYWALWILEQLGPEELATTMTGDGAGSLVEAWAARDDARGRIAIALWNGTLDQTKSEGAADLDRSVSLTVRGLAAGSWTVRHRRLDHEHSTIAARWAAMGGGDWPSDAQLAELREHDRLEALEPERTVEPDTYGAVELTFELPMPAISLIELVPA